jgi:hypothetical protein
LLVVRKLVALAGSASVLVTWIWRSTAAECVGRVDPQTWAAEHPNPPPPQSEPGAHPVRVISTRRIVPSSELPAGVDVQTANNNLDVVRHSDGRVYLAFRSAPNHFASTDTVMYVVSSADEEHWRLDARFALGRDLREPRLLSYHDHLWLYVSRLGEHSFAFSPQGVSFSELRPGGGFSPLTPIYEPGFLLWRARVVNDRPILIGYSGGENLYRIGGSMDVEVLTTKNGHDFSPAFSHKQVLEGGGSETDLSLLGDGSLMAVVRNEEGDRDGFGSKLCRAPSNDLGAWKCVSDRRKFDSPFTFTRNGEFYAIARRNLTPDGAYDIAGEGAMLRYARNEIDYIARAKRCALWRFDQAQQKLVFVLDLPSRGDTCFPAAIDTADPHELAVYDYSSDIDGPELPWAAGQRRPTFIYRHVLHFD